MATVEVQRMANGMDVDNDEAQMSDDEEGNLPGIFWGLGESCNGVW